MTFIYDQITAKQTTRPRLFVSVSLFPAVSCPSLWVGGWVGGWVTSVTGVVTLSFSGLSAGVRTEHVDDLRVFLLVCGLRKVKDPLYLVRVFSGR